MENKNRPASLADQNQHSENSFGITKREYFAAQALSGIMSAQKSFSLEHKGHICKVALAHADEILKQLSPCQ